MKAHRATAAGHRRSVTFRYGTAILVVVATLAVRFLLQPLLRSELPFVLFVPSVMIAAWVGGLGPGLFATFAAGGAAHYFFVQPRFSFPMLNTRDMGELAVFAVVGMFVSWLVEGRFAAYARLADAETALGRLNRDLEQRVADLQTLLDVIPVGIAIAEDTACASIRVNPALARALRLPPGANASVTAPPDEKPSYRLMRDGRELTPDELPMQTAASQGVSFRDVELDLVFPDGDAINFTTSTAPLFDQEGHPRGCVTSFLDITERNRVLAAEQKARIEAQRAEEQARFLAEATTLLTSSLDYRATLDRLARLTVSHLADWCTVDVVDDDGRVRRAAVAHADPGKQNVVSVLRRYSPTPASGSRVPGVIATGRPDVLTDVQPSHVAAVDQEPELAAAIRALEPTSLLTVPIVAGGQVLGAIGLGSARAERRYTDADLPLAEALARRAALAITNARLYESAQEANRLKDEFLATLSHELRTPLNAMLGWARLIMTGNLAPDLVARGLETIERNAHAQAQLVDDVLDVSRIITGRLRLDVEQVELRPVVEAALDAVRPAADAKQVQIELSVDAEVPPISGDRGRLQQVAWNLLSNAIKFSDHGERVEVRVARIGSQLELQVRDHGEGITADFLPYVFDRFRQADSSVRRQHRGLGLGLAIVRHLVELHGGTVAAESAGRGKGAVFTVRFPIRAVRIETTRDREDVVTSASAPQPGVAGLGLLDRLRVLIVDDEADARDLLGFVLEREGATVLMAGSAAEARTVVYTGAPNVLVCDIGMPAEDGYTLVRGLRAAGFGFPAIAVTAYARMSDGQAALEAGFQVHMPKPVDAAELVAVIGTLTGRTGALPPRTPLV
jgi:signal transduction histidine kinase/ActR/RegA family two-component response regulator/PAS domain-containing protein